MSVNLLESIQIEMGYPPLQKVDPNTQRVEGNDSSSNEEQFSQAAIPSVLTALYRYSRTDEGADNILQGSVSTNGASMIFEDNEETVIQKIADYSNYTVAETRTKINTITAAAVHLIKEHLPAEPAIHDVKTFLAGQKNNFLPYLPASLQIGELLHDNTLDDSTNKMGGLLSGLMHTIGDKFSDGEVTKEDSPAG